MKGEIVNLVGRCTDHDTLKHLHEMRQCQELEPQLTIPCTPVYHYVAETPPQPYDDTAIVSPMLSDYTPGEPDYFGFEDRCYPIHFEQDDYSSIWTVSNREEEKPYVGIRSDPIQLSDNGEYPQHYGMPTQWYDGPLVVERGDEEVREETG